MTETYDRDKLLARLQANTPVMERFLKSVDEIIPSATRVIQAFLFRPYAPIDPDLLMAVFALADAKGTLDYLEKIIADHRGAPASRPVCHFWSYDIESGEPARKRLW